MIVTPNLSQKSHTQTRTLDFKMKYKTEKCRYWLEKGYCPYNQSCTFAHSEQQIRNKIHIAPNYKTKICINFSNKGYCTYGDRCQYLHTTSDFAKNEEDGRLTRSNSAESNSSNQSSISKKSVKGWQAFSHNKQVELIQTLGLDFAIRSSSRLMQILRLNYVQNQQTIKGEWDSPVECIELEKKGKKYSL